MDWTKKLFSGKGFPFSRTYWEKNASQEVEQEGHESSDNGILLPDQGTSESSLGYDTGSAEAASGFSKDEFQVYLDNAKIVLYEGAAD